ncbi:phenylalanine--tRNA ligase subunit beta [Candidatus Woesearchaeota archaeon]|nr:phenylalanine--tRNA ligase subunit beta [Candidatus Woesearchaeota archaeon]
MPVVKLNRKVFENLVGKKLPLDELKERISMLGTDLENIDDEIEVEVFPNRPDMLSEQGFARAFSSFIGVKTGLREYKVTKSGEKLIVDNSVSDVRPYTVCAIVKGLSFNDEKIREIIQIQEKLHVSYGRNRKKAAIGIYPMEKIKFPIRYLAKKPKEIKFKPLESGREMTGLQILSQHPAGRDYGHLLEGKDKFPIFVDAKGKVLSLPPIINSDETGKINKDTKEVFIECSGFDYNALSICLNIIVTALADMGGNIYSMDVNYGKEKKISPNLKARSMKLDIGYVNKILGLNLNEKEVKDCLERMGYDYNKGAVLVPAYRADILHQIDLVEDIAIAYGYENFKDELPNLSTVGKEDDFEKVKSKVANILVGFGLIEASNYHLISGEVLTKKMCIDYDYVEVEGSVVSEYHALRNWMIPGLMKTLQQNKHHDYPQKIFEIGTVFKKDSNYETGVKEFTRLGVVSCHGEADYTEVRQILDALLTAIGCDYDVLETDHDSFIKGRVARVSVKGKDVAYIGEIKPEVLRNFDLDMPVSGFELNLSELFLENKKR